MKKILLVDLDDTLLSFKRTSDEAIKDLFNMYNVPYTKENLLTYEVINQAYWQQYERGENSRDIIVCERFRAFFSLFGIECDGVKENQIYGKNLASYVFYEDNAIEFLNKCKELGLTICLVSNGVNAVQTPRLKNSGIDNYLTKRYISENIGYAKPNKEFFQEIEKDFPHMKNDMVILGDSLTSDIQGGINFGITTVWFNEYGKVSNLPDYEIHSLMDFFNLDIMK